MTALWGVFLLLKKQSLFGIQRCRTWGRLCGVVLTGEDIHQTVVLLNGDYRAFGIHVNPSVLCRFFHVFMISELKISLFPLSFPLARLAKGHGKAGKGNSRGSPLSAGIAARHARVCERFLEGRSATVRLCVCVCVSKISGTAKYKALKVARKPLFPRRPLLPPLIFSFAVIFTQSTVVS